MCSSAYVTYGAVAARQHFLVCRPICNSQAQPALTQAAFAGRATPKWSCSPTTAGNLTLGLFPETGGFALPPTRSG